MTALHAEAYKHPGTVVTDAPIIAAPELNGDILCAGAVVDMQGYRERSSASVPTLEDLARLVESGAPAEAIDSLGALCIRSMRTGEKDDVDVEELRDVVIPTEHQIDLNLAAQHLALARASLWCEIQAI